MVFDKNVSRNEIEKYSNAFDDIEIYTLTDGKKRRFFSQETA